MENVQQKMVNLKINGIAVTVPEGTTILQAARKAHIEIPTLCYLKDVSCVGSCRMCVVEATGARGLVAACVYPVAEGMEVRTNTDKCRRSRKLTLELILSKHKKKCLSCERNHNCELQKLSLGYYVDEDRFKGEDFVLPIDMSTPYVVRDNDKCINCMRCVAACRKQSVNAIGPIGRGFHVHIGSAFDRPLVDSPCVGCGRLPGRRAVREDDDGRCMGGAFRSVQKGGVLHSAVDQGDAGRSVRHACRHQRRGQDGRGDPQAGSGRGVQHGRHRPTSRSWRRRAS